jgi:hypothetical protein
VDAALCSDKSLDHLEARGVKCFADLIHKVEEMDFDPEEVAYYCNTTVTPL